MIDSNTLFASASYDQSIRLWDIASGKTIGSIAHPHSQVNTMCWVNTPPNTYQLTVGSWQKISIFDISQAQPMISMSFENCIKNVTAIGFDYHTRWMYSGGDDGVVRIYEIRGNQIQCQRAFEVAGPVTSVVLHVNQVELFIADQTGSVYIWDLSKSDANDVSSRITVPPLGAYEFITKLAIHPGGTLLTGITNRCNLITWKLYPATMVEDIPNPHAPSTQVQYKIMQKVKLEKNVTGLSLRYTPDHRYLAISFSSNDLLFLKHDNYTETFSIDNECGWNWDVLFSNDGRYAFSGGDDHIVKMYDIERKVRVKRFEGHSKPICAMTITDST